MHRLIIDSILADSYMRVLMTENRLVVKINYDSDQRRKELIDPKMVTVWHKGRILVAAAFLLITFLLLGKWFSVDDSRQIDNSETSEVRTASEPVVSSSIPDAVPSPITKEPVQSADVEKSLFAVIFDRRVIRAALGEEPVKGEPGMPVDSPVYIGGEQKKTLFYFSELKNIKDKSLSHHWIKDGQVVQKKLFEVKENRGKLISSRVFTVQDIGRWKVVLIDKKGKLLSEVNFYIDSR